MKPNLYKRFPTLIFFLIFSLSAAPASSEPQIMPLKAKDVQYVSQQIGVEFAVMVMILHVEDGYVGLKSYNPSNGSYDYGPFQVNSCHLVSPEFKAAGITAHELQYNGRISAFAAAFLLRTALIESGRKLSETGPEDMLGIYYEAIGRYHSKTPKFKRRYQKHLVDRLKYFVSPEKTFERANRTP